MPPSTAHKVDALNARVVELLTWVDDLFSGRRLTVVPPSTLVFLWNLNLMPTIHRFTMAILMPVKPFSPSVHLCFHCSLDVMSQKRLRLHSFSLFSRAAPANGESRAPCCATFVDFCQEMMKLFDRSAQGDEVAAQLSWLSQKKCSVTIYAIQFQTLAAACGCN